jgi:hypothetical protein
LYGRTLKVNLAKPLRLKENSTRPVWADDEWLQRYSGQDALAKQAEAAEKDLGINPAAAAVAAAEGVKAEQNAGNIHISQLATKSVNLTVFFFRRQGRQQDFFSSPVHCSSCEPSGVL